VANNTVNVQQGIIGSGAGDDSYLISPYLLDIGQTVTISDTEGKNSLHFLSSPEIRKFTVMSDTAQIVFKSPDAYIEEDITLNILGASSFTYIIGGNPYTGTPGEPKDYSSFLLDHLSVSMPDSDFSKVDGYEKVIESLISDSGVLSKPTVSLINDSGIDGDNVTNDYRLKVSGILANNKAEYSTNNVDWSAEPPTAVLGINTIYVRQKTADGSHSDTTEFHYLYDNNGVSGSIESIESDYETAVFEISFNEPVIDFSQSSIAVSSGYLSDFSEIDNSTYRVKLTSNQPTATVSIEAGNVKDIAGNTNTERLLTDHSFEEQKPSLLSVSLKNDNGIRIDDKITSIAELEFTGLEPGNRIEYSNDTKVWSSFFNFNEGGNTLYARQVTPNGTEGGHGSEFNFVLDTTSPEITVEKHSEDVSDRSITYNVTFNEDVYDFSASDIKLSSGTLTEFSSLNGSTSYLFKVTPSENSHDDITMLIESGAIFDVAGNKNDEDFSLTLEPLTPETFSIKTITTAELQNYTHTPFKVKEGVSRLEVIDLDSDGNKDIVIAGGFYSSASLEYTGSIRIIYGAGNVFSDGFSTEQKLLIEGTKADEFIGYYLKNVGDVNGDGKEDLLTGNGNWQYTLESTAYLIEGQTGKLMNVDKISDIASKFVEPSLNSSMPVHSVGDFNGDGLDDFAVSAGGKLTIIPGISGTWEETNSIDTIDGAYEVNHSATSYINNVAPVGDINGDGKSDIAIADYNASSVYILYGRSAEQNSTDDNSALAGLQVTGQLSSSFGNRIDFSGDYDGDGVNDLLIASAQEDSNAITESGSVYMISGNGLKNEGESINLNQIDQQHLTTFKGVTEYGRLGSNLENAGDINNDGFDDIIISHSNRDSNGVEYSGEFRIVYGGKSIFNNEMDITNPQGVSMTVIEGDEEGQSMGSRIIAAGDIDNDGFDDIVFTYSYSESITNGGEVTLWDGAYVNVLYGSDNLL